jgi:acetoin utilization deacetylase AcuC-like enzyme
LQALAKYCTPGPDRTPDNTGDEEYLKRLENGVKAALLMFRPDLIIYLAGADPFCEDQLGGLSLTFQGLMDRDRFVIGTAVAEKVPVATVLVGGMEALMESLLADQLVRVHQQATGRSEEEREPTQPS